MRYSYNVDHKWLIVYQAIALPTQSIILEKDPNAPSTKRKLTFTDLVAHLRHHNSSVKKGTSLVAPSSCGTDYSQMHCLACANYSRPIQI